ncbi:MAG TPA: inorganic diphosphatase [Cellvibrionaceae bacterium]
MKIIIALLLLSFTLGTQAEPANTQSAPANVLVFPQPKQAPDEIYAVIEIPAGSTTKYELDEKTGFLIASRFQSMPVVYPANYGTLPSSLAGDNDPLDILVYTREPIVPGALIKVRPIGVLRMLDDGQQDDKIIAVPTLKVDPTYADIQDINDLPPIERERLLAFFTIYKDLPKGRKKVVIQSLDERKQALQLIKNALREYQAKQQ